MLKKINLILSFLMVVSCSAQIPTPRVQWVSEIQQYGQRNTGLWIIPLQGCIENQMGLVVS